MSASLESLGYYGVHSGVLAFAGEQTARNHVCHLYACLMQTGSEFLGTARRSEHNLHSLGDDDVHQSVYLGIHQRYVYAPWFGCGFLHLVDMLDECFGVHRTSTEESKTAGIAHCGGKAPTAAPYHTSLYYRFFNTEEFTYSILFH